jgi:hypothetical protein
MNRRSALDRRIDQIFVRGIGPGQTSAPWTLSFLTGTLPWEKTKSGLWASDHAGVAAWMVVWR